MFSYIYKLTFIYITVNQWTHILKTQAIIHSIIISRSDSFLTLQYDSLKTLILFKTYPFFLVVVLETVISPKKQLRKNKQIFNST